MKASEVDADKVFAALADKNRRKVVELLHEKEASVQEMLPYFLVSFQGLAKHVNILADAQIITKTRKGKSMICKLNPEALKVSLKWMEHYSRLWNESFDKLDELINTDNANNEG